MGIGLGPLPSIARRDERDRAVATSARQKSVLIAKFWIEFAARARRHLGVKIHAQDTRHHGVSVLARPIALDILPIPDRLPSAWIVGGRLCMSNHRRHFQAPGQPADVTSWEADEEFPIHPVGTKPKRVLLCPPECREPFLIPGHTYLFKVAAGRRAPQLWSEVIAYRIATLVGLDVPPCFVAVDHGRGEVGALVEFFYAYPSETIAAELTHAADLLQRFRKGRRTDRPHCVRLNLAICRARGIEDAVGWWARALAFDALIGNTDRHPENWGLLKHTRPEGGLPYWSFAPVFDNGTSLGYEIPEERLAAASEPAALATYIKRGRHHCGLDMANDLPTSHMDLCLRLVETYPEAVAAMQGITAFDRSRIADIANECSRFEVDVVFTRERAHFVTALVEARKQQLSTLGGE
jgi:hypothetical protein